MNLSPFRIVFKPIPDTFILSSHQMMLVRSIVRENRPNGGGNYPYKRLRGVKKSDYRKIRKSIHKNKLKRVKASIANERRRRAAFAKDQRR